ncbi:MAG: MerR family transcriptional regulator [Actinomycetota bacterium]
MNEQGLYQIGEVAERVGLSLRTLRYYEEVGIVQPSGRSPGGFRLYDESDIAQASFVKQLKPLEFSLDQIRELLEIRDRLTGAHSGAIEHLDLAERLQMFITAAEERSRALMEQSQGANALAASLRRLRGKARQRTSTRG